MRTRAIGWVVLTCAAVGLAGRPGIARADDAACIAAVENEVGLRKQLKLRDALKELAKCAAPACPAEIRNECSRRVVDLNAALPTIVLGVTDAAGNDLAAVMVTMDGVLLTSTIDGRALPVDPGSHTLHFEVAGKPPVDKTVVIGEGVKDRHIAVVVGDKAGAAGVVAAAPPVIVVPSPAGVGAETASSIHESHGGGMRLAGWAVGGVGVATVVVGSVLGGLAISGSSNAKGECTPSCAANTNPAAHNDMQTATTLGAASTGTFIAGGALVATGLVMVLVGGPKTSTTGIHWTPTVIAHGGGGLSLSGAW
jgi:hypothetical protein